MKDLLLKSFMIANRKKVEIRKLRFFFGNHNCQTIEALNGWRKLNYNEFAKMRMNSVFCKQTPERGEGPHHSEIMIII